MHLEILIALEQHVTIAHDFRISLSMSADEYTAQFEILTGRTNFNDAVTVHLEGNTSSMHATVLLQTVCNALVRGHSVKCWDSNSIEDEGGHQGRIGVNSNGFCEGDTAD